MKIYLSADIEGTCTIVNWDETRLDHSSATFHKQQMTKEVNSACLGANECGCDEIFIKDAHGSARTIDSSYLPENIKIMRGWSGNPHVMMSGIDDDFDASLFIGYHSGATQNGNALSHTMSGDYDYIKINDKVATEFMINAYASIYYNNPVAFISGDKMVCDDAKELFPNIVTVDVLEGLGSASISIHPNLALKKIQEGVKTALSGDLSRHMITLPDEFNIEIKYKNHYLAYKSSFYPGVNLINSQTIQFKTNDYFEFLRMLLFM